MDAVASTVKVWFEGPLQDTDQETDAVVVGVDVGRDVFCEVAGFWEAVEQSPGRLRENVVSVLTGVTGPLLWRAAVADTLKDAPALAEPGAETETLFSLTSVWAKTWVPA
jgi:hypothetical protein